MNARLEKISATIIFHGRITFRLLLDYTEFIEIIPVISLFYFTSSDFQTIGKVPVLSNNTFSPHLSPA